MAKDEVIEKLRSIVQTHINDSEEEVAYCEIFPLGNFEN